MRPSLAPLHLWRVVEVPPGTSGAGPFRPVPAGIDVPDVLGRSAADAVARLRERDPAARGAWLMAITCGRRPSRSSPNSAFFPPTEPA